MIGGDTIKSVGLILLFAILLTGLMFSYTIEQVLSGVEKTTFEEYDIPYFKWVNAVEGEMRAGYDPFQEKGLLGVQANVTMSEKLDLSTSFAFSTDFATDNAYQFSLGVRYDFLRPSDAQKRYEQASREALRRQLKAIELFFDFLKKKVMLSQNPADLLASAMERLEQVDMAYIAITLEALSSLTDGEPQISGLSNYAPKKIDEDIVQTAVIRYMNLFSSESKETENRSLYALFSTDYNTFLQGITGGMGGGYNFEEPVLKSVEDKIDEIEIRKNKLVHDVLIEMMPEIKAEYERLEKEINSATSKIINGEMRKEELSEMQTMFTALENKYIEMTLDAVRIEYIFSVLSGIDVR